MFYIIYYYIQVERWENKEINFNQWAFIELIYSNINYDSDSEDEVQIALKKAIEIQIALKKAKETRNKRMVK